MDLNIIRRFFQVGKFLALTPTTLRDYSATPWQKNYTVLVFFFFTVGATAALQFCWSDYMSENPIALVLWIVTDITRYVHNLYIFISVMIFKRKLWFVLIANLKKTKFRIDYSEYKFLYCAFITSHVSFSIIMSCIIFICFQLDDWYTCLRYYFVEFVQIFTQFFYLSFAPIVLKMIFLRYQHFNKTLQTQKTWHQIKTGQLRLKQTVDTFCEIFGGTILLNIIYNSSKSLIYLNKLIKQTKSWSSGSPIVILMKLTQIGIIGLFWGLIFWVIFLCDAIVSQNEEIRKNLYQMLQADPIFYENKQFEKFLKTVLSNGPEFSAVRFFSIDRSTIFQIMNSIVTFLIVVIQIKTD
ncbi:gustatory receptor 39 [Tribolium castaneum]|uniref:Gustatory receptor n=1 Tax=Tribolium castaneum TaxID=7070 RepID=D2A4I5_TRICA|nr:PREDICTED: uncharacterized protein LOC107398043 [Tribolium castaneum]EFA05765.1 gustatory receptor 39 [Tribolium castaneum]|eukprot:XP_015836230.1 PREDICTED: uncharacterized protein LOC107398043 [Tribolium castaneum]